MRRRNCNQVHDRLSQSGQLSSFVIFILCLSFGNCTVTSPTQGKVPSPTQGKVPSPTLGKVPSPTQGKVPSPTQGKVPSPTPGEVPSPTQGKVPSPTQGKVPSPTPGEVPSPTQGKVPSPTQGKVPSPTQGEVPSPTQGKVPSPTQGKVPSPKPGEVPELLSATTTCNHLLPGLHKLRRGVDITKIDMLPLKLNGGDGFKYPVIDFNCAEGKTRYIGESVYNVPDEVSSIINIPGGYLNVEVNILKNSSDVVKMMSANIGFDSIIKGFFSASASYKHMTANFYIESRYVEHIVSYESTSRADLIPKFALKFGKDAQMFVDKFLPSKFENDPQKYFEFIKTFGTHYFSNVRFGGSFQLYLETMKYYYQGKSDREVKAEASATFFMILKVMGGVSSWGIKKVDTRFTASSNQIIRYYGGDTNLLASGGIASWQPTVAKNPWVIGGHLVPLSDLIDNQSKKESMKKATQMYIDLAYLDSLTDILHWASNKYSSSSKLIANYLQQVQALKTAKASDHEAVVNLGNKIEEELEIPSWFYQKVEVCYKWIPDGDGGQCGGGVGRNLCAKVGNMTDYYRNDTDQRKGGCRMQWGINELDIINQSWLKQIQICYRWRHDGDGGQCGGGVARHICAPIKKFTTEYRDDTDRRGGGCQMQWNLVVPDNAPIWLHNMKFCFQWYPDGDVGQCEGGVNRLSCATASSGTLMVIVVSVFFFV